MDWTVVLVGTAGLLVGSFLSVCILRVPMGRSVIRPRSRCPQCESLIRAWDNIPVLSFLLLRGKCRDCGGRISWVYPVVELSTAALFLLLWHQFGLTPPFFINLVFFCLLLVLAFIDLFHRILPDVLNLSGLLLGLLVSPFQVPGFFHWDTSDLAAAPIWINYPLSLLGILVGGGLLWLVSAIYHKATGVEGMGFGDVKMLAMMGAFLGWRLALLSIFLGSTMGALVGSVFILILGKGRRYPLPFGTFLALGAVMAALWGNLLLQWYLGGL